MSDIHASIRRVRTIAVDHAAILTDDDKQAIADVAYAAHQHQEAMLGVVQLLRALGHGVFVDASLKAYQDWLAQQARKPSLPSDGR